MPTKIVIKKVIVNASFHAKTYGRRGNARKRPKKENVKSQKLQNIAVPLVKITESQYTKSEIFQTYTNIYLAKYVNKEPSKEMEIYTLQLCHWME